ncbi:hypothetical protein TcasGA2_TC002237 [Tribolium castaneum]|uniref:Uncharacterized protein n=1 Tax=Tribolium castaneum TaxID=7070 RepID=D7EKI6_TRICA|nr:hypothetical protein TcasGA2_TC002237 [Tribolium castaneum]
MPRSRNDVDALDDLSKSTGKMLRPSSLRNDLCCGLPAAFFFALPPNIFRCFECVHRVNEIEGMVDYEVVIMFLRQTIISCPTITYNCRPRENSFLDDGKESF